MPSPYFRASGPIVFRPCACFRLCARFRLLGLHVYSACHGPALGGLPLRLLRGFWRFCMRLGLFPLGWPVHNRSSLLGLPVASAGESPVCAGVWGRFRIFSCSCGPMETGFYCALSGGKKHSKIRQKLPQKSSSTRGAV